MPPGNGEIMELPEELRKEEGIPEAIKALHEAHADPDVRALIAHRAKLLALEEKRLQALYREERKKAFNKKVEKCLKAMEHLGIDHTILKELKKRVRAKRAAL